MAACNTILLDAECPACHAHSTIEAQTHIASSFEGDRSGRFCHREYRLGERMLWWPEGDPRSGHWAEKRDPGRPGVIEACYATCRRCRAELFAVVEFEALVVKAVSGLGLVDDWPGDLRK